MAFPTQFLAIDPTLKCVAVSNDVGQIEQIPLPIHSVLSDFENTPLADGSADVVMFNESFGYGDVRALMHESFRLLKPGGKLCIKDYSFLKYSPVVVERQRAWNYTVHAADALVAYAQEQGFKTTRIMPRIPCDFTRWVATCEASDAFSQHAHEEESDNLFAAIYVFQKPPEQTADDADFINYCLKGNAAATALLAEWHEVLHLWDDLIDGDVQITPAAVNAAFTKALVSIPANPFFQQNSGVLLPLLSAGITAWHVSNVMECSGDRELLAQAHMHRVQIGSVMLACAEIVGGRDWAVEIGAGLWRFIQGDKLFEYTREIEIKNQHKTTKEAP